MRGGYESDEFPLTSSNGVIYGAGLQWVPSDRTQVTGFWEHRFFGSSYSAQVSHRLPRTALSASFARGLNTYPQNALTIPAGANVSTFVDAAFATRIPDPAERALAVQQVHRAVGTAADARDSPVNIFAANVLLQTTGTASAVLIGVRNSLAFSVYYTKSDAISGTGSVLPPASPVRPEQHADRGRRFLQPPAFGDDEPHGERDLFDGRRPTTRSGSVRQTPSPTMAT